MLRAALKRSAATLLLIALAAVASAASAQEGGFRSSFESLAGGNAEDEDVLTPRTPGDADSPSETSDGETAGAEESGEDEDAEGEQEEEERDARLLRPQTAEPGRIRRRDFGRIGPTDLRLDARAPDTRRIRPRDRQPLPPGPDEVEAEFLEPEPVVEPPLERLDEALIRPDELRIEEDSPLPRLPREDEPYAPLGLRAGTFLVYPSLALNGVYTDNVTQSLRNREEDAGLRIAPELRIESDWVRHSLQLSGQGDFIFYADHPDLDETTASAAGALRLDVRRDTIVELGSDFALTQSGSEETEVPDAAVGDRVDRAVSVLASVTQQFDHVQATARAGASWFTFSDVELAGGGSENNEDRDYTEVIGALRVTYQPTPALQPFIELEYAPRLHEREVARFGLRRDSHGGSVFAGVLLDFEPVWAGEFGLKYDVRHYEDPALQTVHSIGAQGNVSWRPTPLTTLTLRANSDIGETVIAGVPGVRSYESELELRHLLRRHLILSGGLGVEFDDFVGTTRDDLLLSASVGVSYFIRRGMELLAGYEIEHLHSGTPGNGYVENRVSAGVRFSW